MHARESRLATAARPILGPGALNSPSSLQESFVFPFVPSWRPSRRLPEAGRKCTVCCQRATLRRESVICKTTRCPSTLNPQHSTRSQKLHLVQFSAPLTLPKISPQPPRVKPLANTTRKKLHRRSAPVQCNLSRSLRHPSSCFKGTSPLVPRASSSAPRWRPLRETEIPGDQFWSQPSPRSDQIRVNLSKSDFFFGRMPAGERPLREPVSPRRLFPRHHRSLLGFCLSGFPPFIA